jgi:Ca2+-binding EF-hand superfamily protein
MKHLTVSTLCALFFAVPGHAQEKVEERFMSNWDLNGNGSITQAEVKQMRENIFLAFDSNSDGAIDNEEYDMFDAARANDMSEVRKSDKRRMKSIVGGLARTTTDVDGDGKVTRSEFMETAQPWFEKLDRNGDGAVTVADFALGD